MKYKRILVLLVAAFLFGACGKEKNQENDVVKETFVTLSPEQSVTKFPSVTVTAQPTPRATATPVPEITPKATVTPVPKVTQEGTKDKEDTPEASVTPTPAVNGSEVKNPLDGAFWCELYEDDTVELLTPKEIALINQENFCVEGTALVNLSGMERIEAADVVRMIESYSFPKQKYYDNAVVTETIKAELSQNRNVKALESVEYIEPGFGILTQNADLRSFPAAKPLTASQNGRYDYLQETVLLLNEAVVVLHSSLDGEWCFVQAENYFGWIPETSIAYCERECMEAWYDAMTDTENPDVLLVTKNLEWQPEGNILPLRMGTKFVYEGENDGKIMISVPVRDEEKRLQTKTYLISPEDTLYQHLHRGYLPYTRRNVIRLATTLLDTPYAWGDALPYREVYSYDSEIGMDCSSTVDAVYRCFGFSMPRNTGAQRMMVWQGEKTDGYTVAEKKELLEQKTLGTLFYTPGHVMLYLGEYEGEYYVLHNTTTEALTDGTEEAFYRCVITSMSLGEKNETILERLLEIKTPAK